MKEKFRLDSKTGEFISVVDDVGREIPDPVPMAPPVGFKRQVPLHERIRAMVQHEFLRAKLADSYESPEEADDFTVPDDDDPREASFALMPGHEHDWEEHYEPPKDFKDMKDRLIAAGWKPPDKVAAAAAASSSAASSKVGADPVQPGSAGQVPVDPKPAK